jgi:hypothetical protein
MTSQSPSLRRQTADVIAAAVRTFGLNNPVGGEVHTVPWGNGKRYEIAGSVPKTLDLAIYVNKPNQILLNSSRDEHEMLLSAAHTVAYLYAQYVVFDEVLVEQVLNGENLRNIVPGTVVDEIAGAVGPETASQIEALRS